MLVLGLIEVPSWILLSVVALVLLYIYRNHNYYSFKGTGITGPYQLPIVGFLTPQAIKLGLYNYDIQMKKDHGKLVGFDGKKPQLLIFDEEMLTQVMIKQFNNFTNRVAFSFGEKLFENMLTVLKDDQWKHVRSTMSPSFTTGKLRKMAAEINRCAKTLEEVMSAKGEPFEARNFCGRYTMDVIASTGFGLRVDCQNESNNDFHRYGRKLTEDFGFTSPTFIIMVLCPPLGKLLQKCGIKLFDQQATDFFINVAKETIKCRFEGDKARHDFIQLMANARHGKMVLEKGEEEEIENLGKTSRTGALTDDEIFSNSFIFFLAGFDTTSIGLTMFMYNLALNQECQQKAIDEIDSLLSSDDDITYDTVMKLTYLEQCLQESLRLHPPLVRVDRTAKEDITISGVTIKKGMLILIPVYAIHHDPEYYEDPEKFDPERFSPEEKAKRNPILWLAFGHGPRHCIAQRLAIYEMKVAVAYILRKNRIVTCDKTEIPLTYQTGKWLRAKNGVWLALEKRS